MTHVLRVPRRQTGTMLRMNIVLDEVDMDAIAAAMDVYRRPTRAEARQFVLDAVEEKLERNRAIPDADS